jgi:glycogen debranching enzyme
MKNLEAEAAAIGKPEWRPMLRYVAQLHEKSTHASREPFPYPWEEIGPGYAASPAFGHWDIIHQILDVLPTEPEHARHQILNNLVCQQESGFLPGTVWMKTGEANWSTRAGHPPVWPVAVDEWTKLTGSNELIEHSFEPLVRQIGWWENHRAAEPDGFFYTDISEHRWESGVDEGIRFDSTQPGKFTCVDATSHLYQMYKYAAQWAEIAPNSKVERSADDFRAVAERLKTFLREELFDAETGWFYDIWAMRDPAQRHYALEGMWPMVVGAATDEQAQAVINNLLDPQRFFTKHPPSTVAVSEPLFELRMWRGPSWNSMTFWAARSAVAYGRPDAARALIEAALDDSAQQFERTGTIWEFYHPYGGKPEELLRKPNTEWDKSSTDYLGHNPMLAMARLYDEVK